LIELQLEGKLAAPAAEVVRMRLLIFAVALRRPGASLR